jgi:hypothetical protein
MYEDASGFSPFVNWYNNELDAETQGLIQQTFDLVLKRRGTGMIGSKYLKPLGDHLYQLRIKRPNHDRSDKILIRIYLCFDFSYGVHVFSGYDKGKDDTRARQAAEIAKARLLLTEWSKNNDPY